MNEDTEYYEVEIELDDKVFMDLALQAHNRDMKLNDYLIELLKKDIERRENEKR